MSKNDVYRVSMFKIGDGVSSEYCEKIVSEFASMWIKASGCKKIILLENMYLPWPSDEIKYDYDYMVVATWDREDAIRFEEAGGMNSPAIQKMMEEINQEFALEIQHVSTNFTTFGCFQIAGQMIE